GFATAHVPIDANSATKTPVGIVDPFPSLLWKTASGPQTEETATAIHIAKIVSDAHMSRAWSNSVHPPSETPPVGGCEIVDISHLLPRSHSSSTRTGVHQGRRGYRVRTIAFAGATRTQRQRGTLVD